MAIHPRRSAIGKRPPQLWFMLPRRRSFQVERGHRSQERNVVDAAARCATAHEICRRALRRRRG
eukprot:937349-Prymnesium_polylepis.1